MIFNLNSVKPKDGLTPYIGYNGNWWIGEQDTGVSASNDFPITQKTTTDTSVTLEPNKYYRFPEMTNLSISLAEGKSDVVNKYYFEFTSSIIPTVLNLPDNITPKVEIDFCTTYQVVIENNRAEIKTWNYTPTTPSNGLSFYRNESDLNTYCVIAKGVTDEVIVIPPTYNGSPVTVISDGFLSDDQSYIKKVILPDSITTILGRLPHQKKFIMPPNVNYIHNQCISADEIYINSWEDWYRCLSPTATDHPDSYIPIRRTKICNTPFDLYINNKLITEIEITDDTPIYAFSNCKSITKVNVSAITVPKGACSGCLNLNTLTGIDYGTTTQVIDNSAFNGCSALTDYKCWVPEIKAAAFKGCGFSYLSLGAPQFIDIDAFSWEAIQDFSVSYYTSAVDQKYTRYGNNSLVEIETGQILFAKIKHDEDVLPTDNFITTANNICCDTEKLTVPSNIRSLEGIVLEGLNLKDIYYQGELKEIPMFFVSGAFPLPRKSTSLHLIQSIPPTAPPDPSCEIRKVYVPAEYVETYKTAWSGSWDGWEVDMSSRVYAEPETIEDKFTELQTNIEVVDNKVTILSKGIPVLAMTENDTNVTLEPNKYYKFPMMKDLNISLGETQNEEYLNKYRCKFDSNWPATNLTVPSDILGDLLIDEFTKYELEIVDDWMNVKEYSYLPKSTEGLEYILNNDNASYSVDHGTVSTNLTSLIIGSNYQDMPVTTITQSAFNGYKFVDVYISEGVTTIEKQAFQSCPNLKNIYIPKTITNIGYDAFSLRGDNLKRVYITDFDSWCNIGLNYNVTTHSDGVNPLYDAEEGLYLNNSPIKTASIPIGITKLKGGLLANCTKLEQVLIPEGVIQIGDSAFYNCQSITNIVIPSTVTTIQNFAFYRCNSLTSLYILASTPPDLFNVDPLPRTIQTIFVPIESVEAYKAADNWSNFADKIVAITE